MRYPLLHFVTFLVLYPLVAKSKGHTFNSDVLGLMAFKADLGDPFSKLSSWKEEDDDPCDWIGIKCDPGTKRVTEISLDGFSLSGKIGLGLLRLQSLEKLSLSKNNFSGSLNPKLSQVESLWALDLSENKLSGVIPFEFFGQCRSLKTLSLAKNAFFGSIPPSVSACSTLVALNLSLNLLSGPLPDALWSLYHLRSLDLSANLLVGVIPEGISRLYDLRTVSLQGNRLSGRLPDDVGGCKLLSLIDFSENMLTGGLPDAMQNLSVCSYLNLGLNSLSGEVPKWIGEMKSLEILNLSSNRFFGRVPDELGELILLKRLDFSGNNFAGSLPESMGTCKSLTDLDFNRNSLMGNLPSWIFGSGLQRISLSGNNMNGVLHVPAKYDQSLSVLDLSHNSFSGEIPFDIASFRRLKLLNLSSNSLSGSIPASIGELKSLEVLDISWNHLHGSIPAEVGELVSLKELRLEKNSLVGEIPTQIGSCSLLISLILSENNLTGEIPLIMANLTNIQTIDLSLNKLTGSIPKQLSNLHHLLSFNISHNLLSGDLPTGNFFNSIPLSSLSNNPGFCGSMLNISCPAVLPKPIVLNPNTSSNPSSNPSFSSNTLRHKKFILSISSLVAIGAAALIALGVVTVTVLNIRARSSAANSTTALPMFDDYYSHSPDAKSGKLVMFSGNIEDFSTGAHAILNKNCELGRGGFGTVYKTVLRDGRHVAIKKLTVSSLVKSQEEFEREIKILGNLRHPNLVTLEGYYWTPSLQLLIYEFVSNGSLYKHLHESSGSDHLSWRERFDVILGTAKSLAHLHCNNIIHYNVKSSNILINGLGEAKIADYGLAKLLPMLDRYVLSSKVQSALGYMAPEFACRTVEITEKCDVYGFGVLALEIVTGRLPVEYLEDDVVVLCDVVRGALEEGRAEDCVDSRLGGKFPIDEVVPVIKLGLICTSQIPSNRLDMNEVVKILELIRCPQDSQEEELI
ncbi:uncharacterized protein [Typha angustifolia]|uniref:uncharacterized protein isoform X1 n=1 Tax=Typha angustifolia TaxID=59011 RepID=UPI003C2B90F1